ncbi:hypothetical protein ACET3X_000398 [Alternaria dauci]|uniref:C2 domain-containing protein n=1 Tax=Alternaria dauci TaxID=48095 RepID=A0ABR3UUC4_9PLEO
MAEESNRKMKAEKKAAKKAAAEKVAAQAAEQAAEKAASEVEAWRSSSNTVLGRLTYHLKDLPDLVNVRVEFWARNAPNVDGRVRDRDGCDRVYNHKHQEPAWKELFEDVLLDYKDITAINKNSVGKKNEGHVIIPSSSVRPIHLGRYPLETKLPANKKLGLPERPMECWITDISILTSTSKKDRQLYCKSLNLLIQQRHAAPFSSSDQLRRANEFFCNIPSDSTSEGEMPLPQSRKPVEKKSAVEGNDSIIPLVKGYPARAGNVQQSGESPYSLRIRTHSSVYLSADLDKKMLHVVFDLTCTAPNTYANVYEVLLDIFGEAINDKDVKRLQPVISDLLVGLQVQRNYKPTKLKTTRASKTAWSDPFLIREVVFNEDIKQKIKSKLEDKAEGEAPDVYEYFKTNYNGGKELEHQHLPLIGDGHGSYFPLTKVKFPQATQVFPRTASVLAQPLQEKIHELRLLEPGGPQFLEHTGDMIWTHLAKERSYGRDPNEIEPSKLLEKIDDEDGIDRCDPLDLLL